MKISAIAIKLEIQKLKRELIHFGDYMEDVKIKILYLISETFYSIFYKLYQCKKTALTPVLLSKENHI